MADTAPPPEVHTQPPSPQGPASASVHSSGVIEDVHASLSLIVQDYGWVLMIGAVTLYFLYTKLSTSRVTSSVTRSSAPTNESADAVLARQEQMAAARARMQARLDTEVEKEKTRQVEAEEKKREDKIQQWENLQSGKGYYSKTKLPQADEPDLVAAAEKKKTGEKKPPIVKREYNPLGGNSGGSCSWKPAARRSAGGGG